MSASLHWRILISLRGSKCTESTRILVSISVHREKGMTRRLYITQYTRKNLFNSFVSFLFTLCPTAGSDLFTTVRIKHSTSETFWSFHVVTDLFCSFLIISSFSFHPFSLPSFLFYPLHRLLQQPSLVSFPAVSSRTMPRRKFLSK